MVTAKTGCSRLPAMFVALAVVAISFVLLRPICSAFGAVAAAAPAVETSQASAYDGAGSHGAGHPDRCCDMIGEDTLVKPAAMIVPGFAAFLVVVAPAVPAVRVPEGLPSRAAAASGTHPPQSYYLRSARILR